MITLHVRSKMADMEEQAKHSIGVSEREFKPPDSLSFSSNIFEYLTKFCAMRHMHAKLCSFVCAHLAVLYSSSAYLFISEQQQRNTNKNNPILSKIFQKGSVCKERSQWTYSFNNKHIKLTIIADGLRIQETKYREQEELINIWRKRRFFSKLQNVMISSHKIDKNIAFFVKLVSSTSFCYCGWPEFTRNGTHVNSLRSLCK